MSSPSHSTMDGPSHDPATPLLAYANGDHSPRQRRRRLRPSIMIMMFMTGLGFGLIVVATIIFGYNNNGREMPPPRGPEFERTAALRGVREGVSAKNLGLAKSSYPWTDKLLSWQRTAYHFQPKKNWMNGPLLYKGWYHFFYQYNPNGAVWGNIVWGHAASKDLINWHHLPTAMVPDQWYDANGVWTGSATILPDGQLIMLYTGATNESVQVQNLAYPADPADALLIDWVKYSGNPVLLPPPGINSRDFRDPTTAWLTPHGKWRIIIGSKINKTGMTLVYDTKDFKSFDFLPGVLHAVPGTGMWECVDFYPISTVGDDGLDTSENGPHVKHIVKTSLDDDRNDYYTIGKYDGETATWNPDDPRIDVGIGLRYDYGHFYASKTFYDQDKKRRILWGWIIETDSVETDVKKGWASLQAIPRRVLFDKKTGRNLLLWPVEEVETLRKEKKSFDVKASAGSVVPLDVASASQLDIVAEFEIDKEAMEKVSGTPNKTYSCSSNGGAVERGALGPFGILVLANKDLTEQTSIYFYISKDANGDLLTFFCVDNSRSSKATDVAKAIYGSTVTVIKHEKLSMRILVDHSIVESFGQSGRTCITSRSYPTSAVNEDARVFLFNNATDK
ncbi:hypothetical protein ACS0TY_015563 [Phlomoides rotata]